MALQINHYSKVGKVFIEMKRKNLFTIMANLQILRFEFLFFPVTLFIYPKLISNSLFALYFLFVTTECNYTETDFPVES